VDFRLVMFRPFVGEVLIAKLKTCDKSGLYCMFPFPISVMVNAAFPVITSLFFSRVSVWMLLLSFTHSGPANIARIEFF
jgi:DNA-directed RNA polymerase subunit E'/Rpb7